MRVAHAFLMTLTILGAGCTELFVEETASDDAGQKAQTAAAQPEQPAMSHDEQHATTQAATASSATQASSQGSPANSTGSPVQEAVPVKPPSELPPALRAENSASEPAGPERVKADVGVGAKGRSLQNAQGIARVVVEPVKTLRNFQQSAVFRIQIPQAMQLFKATNGRLPNSHEEFMAQIIKANQINLPTLPPGQKYVYDPQRGELMVERPAN